MGELAQKLRALKRRLLPYGVQNRSGDRVALGNKGERLAEQHLKSNGHRVLGRNIVLRFGEIDIVAETADGLLVVVEVKAGRQQPDPRHRPERHVTAAKRKQLIRLASALRKLKGWGNRPTRFDVIAVEFDGDGGHALRHHIGAFGPTGGRRR